MKNIKTRDLIYCALFAALTAIGAFLHFQLFQATITLQFFFTAMAGLLLGAKLGALSQLLYVVLGLVGVPIFAAGGGFGYIFNPTFGFLLGLIPTAWVIGKIAEKDRSVPRLLLACFAGLAVLYLVGLPYIALIVNVYKGGNVSGMTLATAYMLPYLPGDCLKIVVSVILAPRILKAMERNSSKIHQNVAFATSIKPVKCGRLTPVKGKQNNSHFKIKLYGGSNYEKVALQGLRLYL